VNPTETPALSLLPPQIELRERFLSPDESAALFPSLRQTIAWRQDQMRLGARRIALPRLTAWYGDPGASYSYSGIRNEPLPWTAELRIVKRRIEAAAGEELNSVLLNFYRSGTDSMGWHSDDERELRSTIASLSLGAARTFQLRRKAKPNDVVSLRLSGGSLLLMLGDTQHEWQHRVPKEPAPGERINLTFRFVNPRA
jgi:alkylated DNA repair dioxygenase AlkB